MSEFSSKNLSVFYRNISYLRNTQRPCNSHFLAHCCRGNFIAENSVLFFEIIKASCIFQCTYIKGGSRQTFRSLTFVKILWTSKLHIFFLKLFIMDIIMEMTVQEMVEWEAIFLYETRILVVNVAKSLYCKTV